MAKFEKGNPGKAKGTTNMITRTVKEAVLDAFNELQKSDDFNLVTFAKKNPREFYAIAAKLIPTDIKAEVKATQKITLKIVRTSNQPAAGDASSESAESAG